jgi:cob(I)alamin adenosyltransferase
MAKIYTKTGDDGSTGLIGGSRVRKNDPRIDCYGTIDELNAAIGLAAVAAPPAIHERLTAVQNELFVIGSQLAKPDGVVAKSASPALDESAVARLESEIDDADGLLAPLRQFILPGGSESAARLHLARGICRRAERMLVGLADAQTTAAVAPVPPVIVRYVNRLSDWLFTQARLANHLAGIADVPWQKPGK